MRVIVETQSRARARVRVQTRRVLIRFFEALAGVPLAPRENGVTFRHISPVRQAMRSVVSVQLRGNRQALAMTMGLLFGSIHALFALLNIVAGLLTRSWWIFSVGVVVAALNAGKSYLASGALMSVVAERAGEEADSLRRCRRAGFTLVALVLGMSKTLERIVLQGFGDGYPGALLYVYAAYALVLIATALVNLVRAARGDARGQGCARVQPGKRIDFHLRTAGGLALARGLGEPARMGFARCGGSRGRGIGEPVHGRHRALARGFGDGASHELA
ncbi:hypothetical protein [uncultured Enorma sp.]|uniref:hypothetical protein n=1 Tax=uncultured Enorma sp. TaxID=1714346 RepID=UPI0025D36A42|nr:hypothetical protein [uncultured Enorma sp.]